MSIKVDIVTPEKMLYSGEVEMMDAARRVGQMGICAAMRRCSRRWTSARSCCTRRSGNDYLAVSGGVVEVRPDKVTILADTAEAGERDR
jgi:F-type H+-transporting ATPase subunit epsilon